MLREFAFRSCNMKNNVYVREHVPSGSVEGVIQIAHGISENIERYDDFARTLAGCGFAVAGNDHLGHGRTKANDQETGFFSDSRGWDMAVLDMRILYSLQRKKYPDKPYFLLGHSMGSFLARTYIIRYRDDLNGVLLSATGRVSPVLLRIGLLIANGQIRLHGSGSRSKAMSEIALGDEDGGIIGLFMPKDWISRDHALVEKFYSDTSVASNPTFGLLRDMLRGIRFISSPRNLKKMDTELPVYFFSGDMDPVGENGKGVMRVYKSFLDAGCTDVTLKLYHGGRHEMLNEINRAEVYSDVLSWIKSKIKQYEVKTKI